MAGLTPADSLHAVRRMDRDPAQEEAFIPKGAVAFFAAMMAVFAAGWLVLYAVLLRRS